MVFLQDMELVIGKEVVLGLHGVRMVEKSNMNREVTELDHGGIHVVEIVVWLAVVSTLVVGDRHHKVGDVLGKVVPPGPGWRLP